jgi:hypothetical protein
VKRRDAIKLIGAVPAAAAAAFTWTAEEARMAAEQAQQARTTAATTAQPYKRRFFTAHEYATVIALSDMIIPKDSHSGSASDAGAPEFIDYLIAEQKDRHTAIRGGLVWLDTECRGRFDKAFLDCADVQRRQVLDDIAWPKKARPEMSQGVRFFTTMRDLVAGGFWSSKIGVADIGYMGNTMNPWNGPPAAVLQKLGLTQG